MDLGGSTHPGYVRSGNEDGFFASREHAVFAVADGMGGHEHGEVASHLALDIIEHQAEALAQAGPTELPVALHDTLQAANTAIISQATTQDARSRMGTTLVLATISVDRLYFAHIGDSRLYLLRGDLFTQLTRDHSLVQAMVDRGEISPEEAAIHPLRHQITRVIGGDEYISPEIASQALEPGDVLLLCTDGLSGAVEPGLIKTILCSEQNAQEKADTLVQAALEAGGPDNITAVVVSYQRPRPAPVTPVVPTVARRRWPRAKSIAITVLCLVVFLAALGIWLFANPHYYIAADAQDNACLYQRWPMLPVLAPQHVPTPGLPRLPVNEAKPYLVTFGDIQQGIPVKGKDAGVEFLKSRINETIASQLEEAKVFIEKGDLVQARNYLNHAKALNADRELIRQLEALITTQNALEK